MASTPPKPQGRPPKVARIVPSPDAPVPADAESYLELVVTGKLPADPSRVRAALGLIRYQKAVTRAPVASPTPRQLAKSAARAAEDAVTSDYESRAAEIRAKHAAAKAKKPSAP